MEEVTDSLSMAFTGLFDDAFTIAKTFWTESQGKAGGSFLSRLNKDKKLEVSSAFPPAEDVTPVPGSECEPLPEAETRQDLGVQQHWAAAALM